MQAVECPARRHALDPGAGKSLRECLERCEIIYHPACPFALPEGEDRRFLLEQQSGWGQKNINYDPHTGRAAGFRRRSKLQAERLRQLLADFSQAATDWLTKVLPEYAQAWKFDQVTFRPDEEAARRLPQAARNDLLHVDAFPSRPSNGRRILRLFVNVNVTEPRVWLTSLPFAELLARYGKKAGLPSQTNSGPLSRLRETALGFIPPVRRRRSVYDVFMLRFHDFLKANEEFQQCVPQRRWTFPPGSAWLAFTDAVSHAVLRGRYALEHSYFVALETLAFPEDAPANLLHKACGIPVLIR